MCTTYGSIFSALVSLFPLEFTGNPRVLLFQPFQAARVWGVGFPTKLNWNGQTVKSATAFVKLRHYNAFVVCSLYSTGITTAIACCNPAF
jgi:hypothetical protein